MERPSAHAWYAKQPWPVGAKFVPSRANNQLEMWQGDTFDPETIDREYPALSMRNTFQEVSTYFNVGAINWGLVSGRSQTILSVGLLSQTCRRRPRPRVPRRIQPDGTPYDPSEAKLIRGLAQGR